MNGLTYPNYTALISNLSDKESQGEIMGITQSIQALAMAAPPIISGLLVSAHLNLPILVASAFVLLAWVVFILFYKKTDQRLFHEA
jgi:MFS family permease